MATTKNLATPNLTVAPKQYDPRYQEQLNNVNRIFFNALVNKVNSPVPYGAFYRLSTLENPTVNAMNLVPFDPPADRTYQTAVGRVNSRIYVAETGVYNVQFSAQANVSAGGGTDIITIWLRKNGENVPASTGRVIVSGPNSETITSWNYVLPLARGDYIELAWASNESHMVLQGNDATSVYPSTPAVILTIVWVSLDNGSVGLS